MTDRPLTGSSALIVECEKLRTENERLQVLLKRAWLIIGSLEIEMIEDPQYPMGEIIEKWCDDVMAAFDDLLADWTDVPVVEE